jgi:hypothetical protein
VILSSQSQAPEPGRNAARRKKRRRRRSAAKRPGEGRKYYWQWRRES